MLSAHAPAAPLGGEWGGDRALLTLSAEGATLREDCSEARFGTVTPDAKGRFTASGFITEARPGPQPGDQMGDGGRKARFEGVVQNGVMRLTITSGDQAPRTLTLISGQRVKPIRCY
jgi:hypothetical protein